MDRFDAMQAFARVVETGSFTRAARTLHMSKTTVSQLVQQLEARLQVRLFNRTTRKVKVTADGAAYYERVQYLLAALDETESVLSGAGRVLQGRLRVDVPGPLARLLLLPALPEFMQRYPGIHLDLGVSDRHVSLIDESVDCVIRGGDITDTSLVARHIADLPLGLYASPDYLARCGEPVDPLQLQEAPHYVVGYRQARTGRTLPYYLQRGNQHREIHGRHRLTLDDGNACLAAGEAGLGIIGLPCYMMQTALEKGLMVPLLTDWTLTPMPLWLAYPPNRHLSQKLRVFIAWLGELMASHVPRVSLPAAARK